MLTNCFTLNDLDLLTALANYAAVAVERARLNQKIVAEEKKRERLGRFLSPQVTSRILATSDSQGAALGRARGEGGHRSSSPTSWASRPCPRR